MEFLVCVLSCFFLQRCAKYTCTVYAFLHECKYCLNFHFHSLKISLQFVKGKTVTEVVNCPKLINLMVAAFVCVCAQLIGGVFLRNSCMITFYSWIHDML